MSDEPKFTQDEVDSLLNQERYKNACFEALRAMRAFGSPPYLMDIFVLGNPEVFPQTQPEEKKT